MTRFSLPQPLGGLSTDQGVLSQPSDTSRLVSNMRPIDRATKRRRLATRSGQSKAMTDFVDPTAKPARALATLITNRKRTTFSELAGGNSQGKWRFRGSERAISRGVKVDQWSNTYWLNGNADIIKRNPDGEKQWSLSLPVPDTEMIVRAIDVTPDGAYIFAGVSEGGDRKNSRLWCYRPVATDEPPQLLWEFEGTGYVQDCKFKDGRLHTIQDFPDTGKSALAIYRGAATVNPELDVFNEQVPFPTSGLDVGPDGSSYIAAPANLSRGADPRHPRMSPPRKHFTLNDLPQIQDRLWAWYRADFVNPFSPPEDGVPIDRWFDLSGNSRHLKVSTGRDAPVWIEDSITGRPGVRFTADENGTGMESETNLGTWLAETKDPDKSRTVFPSYSDAGFAAFFLVRSNQPDDGGVTNHGNETLWQQDFNDMSVAATTGVSSWVRLNWDDAGASAAAQNGFLTWLAGRHLYAAAANDHARDADPTTWDSGDGIALISMVYERVTLDVTDATNATPIVVTTSAVHGLTTDDAVVISGVGGNANANGTHRVTVLTTTTFELYTIAGVAIAGSGAYTSGGEVDFGRCEYRVNGMPYDNFTSTWRPTATTAWGYNEKTFIGSTGTAEFFEGDIIEMLVLRDYKDEDDGVKKVITTPDYPNVVWSATSDTEIERIEGMMMWEYGAQHALDDGTINSTTAGLSATTSAVYPHPFHLRRRFFGKGATFTAAGPNTLVLTGAFADYIENLDSATYPDTIEITGGTGVTQSTYTITSKDSDDQLTLSGTIGADAADVEFAFTGAIGGLASDRHEFTSGAPPDPGGRGTDAAKIWYRRGLSYATILEKWGPGGTELKWNFTYAGGLGYGVKVAEIDDDVINVWSVGPHYTSSNVYARSLEDLGDDYNPLTAGTPGTNAWTEAGADATDRNWTYQYMRIDVDKFGTVYIPHYDADCQNANCTTDLVSFMTISKDGADKIEHRLNLSQQAHAIVHDPAIPEYEDDDVDIAEFVYIASRQESATTEDTHHKHELTLRSLDAGASPREIFDLAIANGQLIRFDSGAPLSVGTISTQANDIDSPWIQMLPFYSKVYILDGRNYKVFDPKDNYSAGGTVSDWESTSAGGIPKGAKLGMVWNGRIVLARFDDDPHLWAMSAKDDALDWDLSPPVVLTTQAISGPLAPAGRVPDVITALIPWLDDIAVVGCDHQIWLMRGDPMAGGRIDQVTQDMGIAFGTHPYAIGDGEVLYFINDHGQFCQWPLGGRPVPLSESRIDGRLQDIDLSVYMPELVYDREARGIHVFLTPFTATHAAEVEHYFYCDAVNSTQGPGSFWPETFGSVDLQPMCAYMRDADDPDDRRVIIGSNDGFLREIDPTAADDDGTAILSDVVYGPLSGKNAPVQGMFTAYEAELAHEQNGARLSVYVHDRARVNLGEAITDGYFEPGRADRIFEPARGSYVYLRLRSPHQFAVEDVAVDVEAAGPKRRVGV